MKSSEIQLQIDRLKSEEALQRGRLDAMIPGIRNELVSQADNWIKKQAQHQVEINSLIVVSMGMDKLTLFKKDLKELCASLPTVVFDETTDPSKWVHNQKDPKPSGEEYFTELFRKIVSRLGPILNEYGITNPEKGSTRAWTKGTDGRVWYGLYIGSFLSNCPIISQYVMEDNTLRNHVRRIAAEEIALTTAKAKEMWESA